MKALDAAFVYEEEVVVEEFIQGTENSHKKLFFQASFGNKR